MSLGQISLCTSCPSTCIALMGFEGQRFSHAPQPMHFSSLTTGMRRTLSRGISLLSASSHRRPSRCTPAWSGTICMAPAGHLRAQSPHGLPSLTGTQRLRVHTACPTCMAVRSSTVTGCMADVGHTSEHRVHSGRQYPRSKLTSGCMKWSRLLLGRSTSLGHALMQSWHAVQCVRRFRMESEPGGVMGFSRCGFSFLMMSASPPSVVLGSIFFCALASAVPASSATPVRTARRPVSSVVFSSLWVGLLFCFVCCVVGAKCMASKVHCSWQLPQATHRV